MSNVLPTFGCYRAFPQTTRRFVKGEPVVEYKGTLLPVEEARVGFVFILVQNLCNGKVINHCAVGKAREWRRCDVYVLQRAGVWEIETSKILVS